MLTQFHGHLLEQKIHDMDIDDELKVKMIE